MVDEEFAIRPGDGYFVTRFLGKELSFPLLISSMTGGKGAEIARINRYHAGLFAGLIDRLAELEEDGERLLDRTLLVYGSGIADGNSHAHYDMPIVLAGRAGGLQTGRYVNLRGAQRNNEPLANLYLRILADAGAPQDRFGDDGDRVLDV